MTEAERQEARAMYRQAKDKARQFKIPTELYLVSREEMRDVLGVAIPKAKRGPVLNVERVKTAMHLLSIGRTSEEIARALNVSRSTVDRWRLEYGKGA